MIYGIAALLAAATAASVWATQPARLTLMPGAETITREQPVDGSTIFEVFLGADQATVVDVQQQPVDLALIVRAPDGRVLIELDSSPGGGQFERATIIANEAGLYSIEIRAGRSSAPAAGRYSVRLAPVTDATESLRQHFRGEQLMARAHLKRTEGTKTSLPQALDLFDEAIAVWESLGESFDLADALNVAGETSFAIGDLPRARDYFVRALPAWRAANQPGGEGQTLNNLGVVSRVLGDLPQALEYLEQSLALRRQTKDRRGEGQTLSNMASIYAYLEDYHRALDHLREALPIRREVGDVRGEANTLHIMGAQHFALGDYEEAYRLAQLALQLRQKAADRPGEANTLDALAVAERARGHHAEAVRHLEASLALRTEAGDLLGEAATRHKRGELLADVGDDNALQEWARALALAQQVQDRRVESDVHHSLGEWYLRAGDMPRAREAFEQALAIRRHLADATQEAATLVGLATVARRDDLHGARRLLETALERVEMVRRRLGRDDLRASLLASRQPHFEAYVDVLLELHLREPGAGHAEAALIASDRARARNLRELLAESPDAIREGVPEALLQREQQTRQQVQAREADRMRVAAQKSAAVAEIDRADRAVATALAEYREVLGELRRVSPRYAALTQSAAISLDEIRAVIGDDTVVLSYWLGRSRSAAFVISRDAVKVAILPVSRSEVETAARRLHEAISKGPSVLLRTEQERAQAAVSAMILRPVSAWLTRERVVVVPDGALHYVPFATLSSTDADEPLIVHKEIVQAPSLAAMVALDREAVPTDGAGMRIAVLADPVLASSDPRVVSRGRITPSHAASTPDLIRSANAVGWSSFARLPYTRDEASSIGKLATHGRASLALDFEASRRTALDRKLNEFDVVHFATHGIINSSRPELSGIVLSLVNPQGQAEDGFLRLHDIYNMKLNAGLVVLSACRTALGADIRGEGLVGLTRGFMYAGAPRVVASLWDVRDRSTAELMTRFYRYMLHDGLAPAAALRQAQRSMWREPRWRHPANWGAFLLQGSWK